MAVAFALHSTYHSHYFKSNAWPAFFGRDMILNVQHLTNWTAIKKHKQQLILKNNQLENSKRIPYQY
jgi:hypothetical protein